MTAADDARIDHMATARAVKAVRLWLVLFEAKGGMLTANDVAALGARSKDDAVRLAGVKVASEGTWKVVQAIAASFEAQGTREAPQALLVDRKGPERAFAPMCRIPGCGCTGEAHP